MDSYIFTNKGAPGKNGHDEVVVEIDPEIVGTLFAEAQVLGTGIAYSHTEVGDPGFEVKRVNGAHVCDHEKPPYAELHVHAGGRIVVAVVPLPYTVAIHADAYEDFSMESHNHTDW